jgi:hypothetical protein
VSTPSKQDFLLLFLPSAVILNISVSDSTDIYLDCVPLILKTLWQLPILAPGLTLASSPVFTSSNLPVSHFASITLASFLSHKSNKYHYHLRFADLPSSCLEWEILYFTLWLNLLTPNIIAKSLTSSHWLNPFPSLGSHPNVSLVRLFRHNLSTPPLTASS